MPPDLVTQTKLISESEWLSLAEQGLRAWGIDPSLLELVSESENISFHVIDENQKHYVLRFHRPGYHTLAELESEQVWTEALLDASLDVPKAIKTTSGQRYTQVQVRNGSRHVGLLEWVPGRPLSSLLENSSEQGSSNHYGQQLHEAYANIGKLLALLHNQATSWKIPENFQRHKLDAQGLMGEDPFWGPFWETRQVNETERTKLNGLRAQLYDLLIQIPISQENFSLIHSDLHAYNIIMHGDDLHIIDFDDSGFGWHAYDFAVALGVFDNHSHWQIAEKALFEGYATLRQCAPFMRELVPLFTLIRTLASIGWTDARPEHNQDGRRIRYLFEKAELLYTREYSNAKRLVSAIKI